jgi:hypothetical protein
MQVKKLHLNKRQTTLLFSNAKSFLHLPNIFLMIFFKECERAKEIMKKQLLSPFILFCHKKTATLFIGKRTKTRSNAFHAGKENYTMLCPSGRH